MNFEKQSSSKRFHSMLKVDLRRMFKTNLFYIMFLVALVTPILILVMTTMVGGATIVDPQTGAETVMESFTNTWQSIASISGDGSAMAMDMTSMMNMNMVYFLIAVFVCTFVAGDFKSGYAKVLFTGRSKRNEYVKSKFIVGFIQGVSMLGAWLIGSIIGGSIAGLSFDLGSAGVIGLIMCLLSKAFLIPLFVSIFLLMSTIGKQRLWLSLMFSLMIGMLFYMIVPMMSPLNSTVVNAGMCLVGGLIFGNVINLGSNAVLRKTDLV